MPNNSYESVLNQLKEPNTQHAREALIKEYGSLNNAVIRMTDQLSYDEVEKLNQFLDQEITDGDIVYALKKTMDRRCQKDIRDDTKSAARQTKASAIFAALSSLGSLVVAVCMVISLKGCQGT